MTNINELTLPDKAKPIEEQSEFVTAAMCAWAEARGEGLAAMYAVLNVIRNRANNPSWWGKDPKSVILRKFQFSSFLAADPNRAKMLDPLKYDSADIQRNAEVWHKACRAVAAVFTLPPLDITEGATHYHDTSIRPPDWAKDMKRTCQIGRLVFYK